MAFPNVIYGSDGDQFVVSAPSADNQGAPGVGDQLILNDSREYRYSQAGAVAVVVGKLYQAPIPVAAHVLQTAAAAAAGATSVALTLGATAVTANQYHNGWLVVDLASNTGFGYTYGIKTHAAVAASGVFTVPLKSTVQVAIATTANSISLVPNNYAGVILAVATTPTAVIAGVSVKPIPIGDFGWTQTRGPCMCLTTGTIVIGQKVFASTTTGAVIAEAAFSVQPTIGYVERVATTTNYSTIDIRIDG
jgi:hypothetical protein